ncbi:MAG: hypothetical protein ACRDA4_07715, partial [Filifactoraceae bacterium]
MNLLRKIKKIRIYEIMIRLIPLLLLLLNFYLTFLVYFEKESVKSSYYDLKDNIEESGLEKEKFSEEDYQIDIQKLIILLEIASNYNYEKLSVSDDLAVFEFTENSFKEVSKFEEVLKKNKCYYNLQRAEGGSGWNGMRVEVII